MVTIAGPAHAARHRLVWVLSNVERRPPATPTWSSRSLPGWTAVEIGDAAPGQRGVIDSSAEFQADLGELRRLQRRSPPAATCSFPTSASARRSTRCAAVPRRIVPDDELLLPPGLTLAGIAERVGKLPGKSADAFLQVAQSGTVRSRYAARGCHVARGPHLARHLLHRRQRDRDRRSSRRSSTEFDNRADELGLAGADAIGLPPYQAVIVASLIQTESGSEADSPIISAVIRNRLDRGHAAADRRHPLLRQGRLPAGARRRRPQDRLAVQHLQGARAATHADRDGVGQRRLTAALNPTADTVPVLRVRQERRHLLRNHPGRARAQRAEGAQCRLSRGSTPSTDGAGRRDAGHRTRVRATRTRSSGPPSCTRGQTKKGADTPYVAHLLGVAALVLDHGGSEAEAIAALLHDSIEDAGVSPKQIRRRFGAKVAAHRRGLHRREGRRQERRRRSG